MHTIVKEFREFAMRGNVIDMAVGIIIGAAFGKIVSAFVDKIIMPPLGVLIGGVNFTDLAITLKEAEAGAPAVILGYGAFLQAVLDFTIIAFAIFMAIKLLNQLKREAPPAPKAPAKTPEDILLLREIRDALKKKK